MRDSPRSRRRYSRLTASLPAHDQRVSRFDSSSRRAYHSLSRRPRRPTTLRCGARGRVAPGPSTTVRSGLARSSAIAAWSCALTSSRGTFAESSTVTISTTGTGAPATYPWPRISSASSTLLLMLRVVRSGSRASTAVRRSSKRDWPRNAAPRAGASQNSRDRGFGMDPPCVRREF